MSNDIDYDTFIAFIRAELDSSENKSLNALESLVEFFQENPPPDIDDVDSDFGKEEIERRARDELRPLLRHLQDGENSWLTVEDGKFKLLPSLTNDERPQALEQRLTDDELRLYKSHFDSLDKNKRERLLNLYEHIVLIHGTVRERTNVLEKIYNAYRFVDEKDSNYLRLMENIFVLVEEEEDSSFYQIGYEFYEDTAKYYRVKYEHDESAKFFKHAIKVVDRLLKNREKIEFLRGEKLRLTRSMRIQHEHAGDGIEATKAFIEENKLIRIIDGKSEKSWIHIISDNCQNPTKVAVTALLLILLSTFIFSLTGITYDNVSHSLLEGEKPWYCVLWDAFYFSVVTFTTLGYGDFSPGHGISRLIANIVSVLGLLLSSLFLVTLVRKYGR